MQKAKRFVSLLLSLCMVLAMLPTAAFAADTSGKCGDNLTWSYSNGTLTIQGTGPMYNYEGFDNPWLDYEDQISSVWIDDGVTTIGDYAFNYCENLTNVRIPEGVTAIGDRAFSTTGLTSVTLPNSLVSIGVNAFMSCRGLSTLVIPNNVRTIGVGAFGECRGLTSVHIPASATTVEESAFYWCTSLKDVYYGGTEKQWKQLAIAVAEDEEVLNHATIHCASEQEYAAQVLNRLGLFSGVGTNADDTPIYDLDRAPTRQEAITMLVRLLGKEEEAKAGAWKIPFTDVVEWAVPYVGYAYTNGLVAGLSNTVFGSQDSVSAAQYLTFILRALGYSSGTDFQWDAAWELSDKIGLTDGRYNAGTTSFTRGDVVIVSESMLSAKNKGSDTTVLSQLVAAGAVSEKAANSYKENDAAPAENAKPSLSEVLSAPFQSDAEMEQIGSVPWKNLYAINNFYTGRNSANGVILNWGAKNLSGKQIKYLTFTAYFYNAVGDLVEDEITGKTSKTLKVTGPIGTYMYIHDIIGYCRTCTAIYIGEVTVEFMDGTIVTGDYNQLTSGFHNNMN